MAVVERELDVFRMEKHRAFQERFLPLAEAAVEKIQEKFCRGDEVQILVTNHGSLRETERCIARRHILEVLESGYAIEYQGRCGGMINVLLLGYVKIGKGEYRPLHVAVSIDEGANTVYIKTAYDPRSRIWQWDEHFEKRKFFYFK